jgi:hypothetical protein
MRNDEIRTALEIANRYYASDVRVAKQALSAYSRIEPSLRRLVGELEQFQNYTHYMLVKSFTFARGGWHDAPLMEASPEGVQDTVRELADVPDDEVKRKLDEEMSEYFREADCSTLKNMIDQWVLFPDWRSRVIDDAFEAHKRGKYTLSIPTLAPQIEGMLRDETGEYGGGNDYIYRINTTLGFTYYRKTPPSAPSVEDLNNAIDRLLELDFIRGHEEAQRISLEHALFRVNALYDHGDFSDPEFVNSTNRHAILHGVASDFSEVHSLKLFCAVQLVHEIVDAYREAIEAERGTDQT